VAAMRFESLIGLSLLAEEHSDRAARAQAATLRPTPKHRRQATIAQ